MRANERPILMCGEMVRATLGRRKTQTRRIVDRIKGLGVVTEFHASDTPGYDWIMRDSRARWNDFTNDQVISRCPYGKVGDRLWVRETWATSQDYDGIPLKGIFYDRDPVWYQADGASSFGYDSGVPHGIWRPSIHMYRFSSRILLEIVDVRVERVQAITEADCYAEGITIPNTPGGRVLLELGSKYAPVKYLPERLCDAVPSTSDIARAHYASLWDGINADRGFGWEINPLVWAITFKIAEGANANA